MRCQFAIMLIAVVVACGGKKHDDHDHDEKKSHEGHEDHDDHDHPGSAAGSGSAAVSSGNQIVKIAPEMLRDLRVTTAKAEARAAGERIAVLAELRVNQDAYAEVASSSTARVVRVLVKAGDEVKVNQPLVELSSGDVAKARAEVQGAQARVEIAKAALARKQQLLAERLIPERDVTEARAALAEAEASRTVAGGGLSQFGGAQGASGLVLRAPVAGTVIDRDVVLGQLVDPSKTLFRIGDLSKLWLIAHVFERDVVRVMLGAKGVATFAALPNTTVEGTVAWVGREVETASRTVPVRLDVTNPGGVLRPGMSATVSIPMGVEAAGSGSAAPGTGVIAVPMAAVQRVDDDWVVFIPRGTGVFEARPVGRGRDLGGEVEVLSGLTTADEVVVDGAFLLKAECDKARGEGGHDHAH